MPNSLYGSVDSKPQGALYGSPMDHAGPLSQRNQDMAQQLGLPGHEGGAGSQVEAQSDWANFEDVFNKNRGYAQRELDAAKGQVEKTANPTNDRAQTLDTSQTQKLAPGAPPAVEATPRPSVDSPRAAPTTMNPAAPAQLRGGTLTQIQQKADLLSGFGQPAAVSGGSGLSKIGSSGSQQVSQQADTAAPGRGVALGNAGALAKVAAAAPTGAGEVPAQTQPLAPAPAATTTAPVEQPAKTEPLRPEPVTTEPTSKEDLEKQLEALGAPGMDSYAKRHPGDVAAVQNLGKANDLLQGWGDDNGLNVLQKADPHASQYDADLMATGGGRAMQRDLSAQYKSQYNSKKAAIVDKYSKEDTQRKGLLDQLGKFGADANGAPIGGQPVASGGPAGPGGPSNSYGNIEDFLSGDGGLGGTTDNLHIGAITFSPADMAINALGESGTYAGPNAAEMFRATFTGNYEQADQNGVKPVDRANIRWALGQIQHSMGVEAARWLWSHITDANFKQFAGKNAGYIKFLMKQLLQGYTGPVQSLDSGQHVESVGGGGVTYTDESGQQITTTDEEETNRNMAYIEGWGEEYDRQFRSGNRNPVKP